MSDIRESYTEDGRKNMNPSIKKEFLYILTEILRERIRRNHLPLPIEVTLLAKWDENENNWKVINFEFNYILFTDVRDTMKEFKMNERLIERMLIWTEFCGKNKLTWKDFSNNSIEYITWYPIVFDYLDSHKKWNISSQEDFNEYLWLVKCCERGIWRIELSDYNKQTDMIETYDYYHLEIYKGRHIAIKFSKFLEVARDIRLFLNELITLTRHDSYHIFKVMKYSIIFITTEEQDRDEIYFHMPYKVMKWIKMRDIEYRDDILNRINDKKDNWYREDNWEHESHVYIDKIFWIDFFAIEKAFQLLDKLIFNEDKMYTCKNWYIINRDKLINSIGEKMEKMIPFKEIRYSTMAELENDQYDVQQL